MDAQWLFFLLCASSCAGSFIFIIICIAWTALLTREMRWHNATRGFYDKLLIEQARLVSFDY